MSDDAYTQEKRHVQGGGRRSAPLPSLLTTSTAILVVMSAALLALAGCGYSSTVKDGGPVTTVAGTGTTESTGPTTDTTTPEQTTTTVPGETVDVLAFFMKGEYLAPVRRHVPATKEVAKAAMMELVAGPTAEEQAAGFVTAIPDKTLFLGVEMQGSVATVDLSKEYESGGGSMSMFARLGQVVYTLTQFPSVSSVSFKLDGQPIEVFSGEGLLLEHPMTRADNEYVTNPIHVESPVFGDTVTSPLRIYGTSNVFEATSQVRILDSAGGTLNEVYVTATSGTGTRGTYDVTVPFTAAPGSDITLMSFEYSAKDGSMINISEIPLHVAP
ncbi:MAG TPA: GerMN domain-containing protein [Thermoleophilia bacterium]|nr:GerMN domain-containing protein [Thermoleophilia bacterium]